MLRVQFNNHQSRYVVDFQKSNDVISLTGEKVPKNKSGFKLYRMNGEFLGDYSEYTEIVAELENGVQFGKRKHNM